MACAWYRRARQRLQAASACRDECGECAWRVGEVHRAQRAVCIEKHNGKLFLAARNGKAIGLASCMIFFGEGDDSFLIDPPKSGFVADLVVAKDMRARAWARLCFPPRKSTSPQTTACASNWLSLPPTNRLTAFTSSTALNRACTIWYARSSDNARQN